MKTQGCCQVLKNEGAHLHWALLTLEKWRIHIAFYFNLVKHVCVWGKGGVTTFLVNFEIMTFLLNINLKLHKVKTTSILVQGQGIFIMHQELVQSTPISYHTQTFVKT